MRAPNHNEKTEDTGSWFNKKTLLIVDDDDELREALAEQLELHEEFRSSRPPMVRKV